MARSWVRPIGISACVAALVAVAVFQNRPIDAGPRPDLKPSAHWIFDAAGVTGNKVADRVGKLTGTVLGSPKLVTGDPTPRLELAGPGDGVLVRDRVTPDAEFLPKEALSLVAWVRIDESAEWGGIVGCMQDNGPNEFGFILGYNKDAFYLGVATKQVKKLTYLNGKTKYERGKWYHVAGVYDGKQMRVYVNGKLDGESSEQSGPILYAKSAPFVDRPVQGRRRRLPDAGRDQGSHALPARSRGRANRGALRSRQGARGATFDYPARPEVRRRAVPAVRYAHDHDRDVGDGNTVRRGRRVRRRSSRRTSPRRSRSRTRWARLCSRISNRARSTSTASSAPTPRAASWRASR